MASKRKRRRQAARNAARRALKMEKERQMVTSTAKVYKDYKVAVQKNPNDVMTVFTIREHDENNLLPFIARIQEVADVKELAHLDIHLQLANGDVQIMYESSPTWPKGVQVKRNEGFIVRGKDRALTVQHTAKEKVENAKATQPTKPTVTLPPLPPPGVQMILFKRYVTTQLQLTSPN